MSFVVDSYRTFIAIELPDGVRARVRNHIINLQRELPAVKASWTREENLHLTLKFLGNVPVADMPKLSAAVEAAAHMVNRFELVISGCGAFPPHGQPKVLWIGIADASGELIKLQAKLEDGCDRAGFARERRPFHPHLTVARLRSAKYARQAARLHQAHGFDPLTVEVREIQLMRSELTSDGSRYTTLARHKLSESH